MASEAATGGRAAGSSRPADPLDARWAAIVAVALVGAFALLLWTGRGGLFSVDDLLWFMASPGLDLDAALQPHNGHLIAVPRLVYHATLELLGAGYAPIRALTALAATATGLLFFIWAARRVPRPVALAGMLLLLGLGTSYIFLLAGDGLMVWLSLATGLGALLALERRDPLGDGLACGLLCVGVLSYSVALAMVVAAAVAVICDPGRGRRIWVPALPVLLYGAWWLWAQGNAGAPGDQVALANLPEVPAYAFRSLSSALGALSGLDFDFSVEPVRPEFETTQSRVGPALALVAIAAVAWRLRRPAPAALWAALGFLVALWALGALTEDAASPPDSSRFVLFLATGALMVGAAATSGARWPRAALVAVWALAACGLASNLFRLHEGGEFRRDADAPQMRAELTGIELAGSAALARPDLSRVAGGAAVINFPFDFAGLDDPSGDYLEAVRRYGRLGFEPAELRAAPEELRARADAALLGAVGATLEPRRAASGPGCARVRAGAGGPVEMRLPAGGATIAVRGRGGAVALRRFADRTAVELGTIAPGEPVAIRLPAGPAGSGWTVTVSGRGALVCPVAPPPP